MPEELALSGASEICRIPPQRGLGRDLPISDFLRPTTIFVLRDGDPVTAAHGYPLCLMVPNLYAWKSVKWVPGIELLDRELPGFWEENVITFMVQ